MAFTSLRQPARNQNNNPNLRCWPLIVEVSGLNNRDIEMKKNWFWTDRYSAAPEKTRKLVSKWLDCEFDEETVLAFTGGAILGMWKLWILVTKDRVLASRYEGHVESSFFTDLTGVEWSGYRASIVLRAQGNTSQLFDFGARPPKEFRERLQKVINDQWLKTKRASELQAESNSSGSSIVAEISQLAELHRQGALSDVEFAAAKNKLLKY